jgi:L-2,4-diaminobutyric acid acetyltransferase
MASLSKVIYRLPEIRDAARIWQMVTADGKLDDNSPYCYLLLSSHFSRTSVVAESEGRLRGFIAAYLPPDSPGALFIWQIAVAPEATRQGIASRMVDELLTRMRPAFLEATVTPSNNVSREFFNAVARQRNVPLQTSEIFPKSAFPGGDHEAEILYRIGPLGG